MAFPRPVTAAEVLAERAEKRKVDPGHRGDGFYGFMPVCHCPNCRDYFDPTGEHVAAYLNCEPSCFDKLAYLPEFGPSELRTYSFYNARKPGIYVQGPSGGMLFSSPVKAVRNAVLMQPPSPHVLNLYENGVEDHFYLNATGNYSRFTYVKGELYIYKDASDKEVSPEKVMSKMTVLNPEDDFDWEEQDFIPLESGGGPSHCDGCEQGHLNQLGHMGPGGCLEERYEAYCHLCKELIEGVTDSEFTIDESIHVCDKCVETK